MRKFTQPSSSHGEMQFCEEQEVQLPWKERILEIVETLRTESRAANLGDNPASGHGFVEDKLKEACLESTIQGVIVKLDFIKGVILARINAWHRFTGVAESREIFANSISQKIESLTEIEQEILRKGAQPSIDGKHEGGASEKILIALDTSLSPQIEVETERQKQQLAIKDREIEQLARDKQELLNTKSILESREKLLVSEKHEMEIKVREQNMQITHIDEKLKEKEYKIKKQKEKRKDVEEQLKSATDTAQEVKQKIVILERELSTLKENNDNLSAKIEKAQLEIDGAKLEAHDFKKKAENLASDKEKTEQRIEKIRKDLENQEGNSKELIAQLKLLNETQSELQNKLKEEEENTKKAEQKISDTEGALETLAKEKESLADKAELLLAEKIELETQKNSLEMQKEEIDKMLEQQRKEKIQLEEQNKLLEKDAANWQHLRSLALTFMPPQASSSGTMVSVDDTVLLNFLCTMLKPAQPAQEEMQYKGSFEKIKPKPYTSYRTIGKGKDGKPISEYELSDMQAMLAYRKPPSTFNVIKFLLNQLGGLNAQVQSSKESHNKASSISSSSSAFLFPNQGLKLKIHNIQVILCYFLLYNAPMCFLVEQAIEVAKKNQGPVQNSWNTLQILNGEIPGLDEVEGIIQKVKEEQGQKDDYMSYSNFVTARIAELSQARDRDGKLLSIKYKETYHTFKWHQLSGLIKLFESQNIAEIFGDSKLAATFAEVLRAQLKKYQNTYKQDPKKTAMDIAVQDEGTYSWVDGNATLLKPQI